jgi:mRNA interferase HigB
MRIIAKKTLRECWEQPQYRDAAQPWKAWDKVAEVADWATPTDVRADDGHASILTHHRVCFNIAGNKDRLVVHSNSPYRVVYIRFLGTYATYDRIDAPTV